MIENLKGSRVVRAFNLQKNQCERYDEANSSLKSYNIKSEIIIAGIAMKKLSQNRDRLLL